MLGAAAFVTGSADGQVASMSHVLAEYLRRKAT